MSTPNTVDAYTRNMVQHLDEKDYINTSTGFQAFFGRPETGSKTVFQPDDEVVEIDIMRANEKIAATVPRGINAKILGGDKKNTRTQQFTNFVRSFPLIEEEGNIGAIKLGKRRAGEASNSGLTRFDRLKLDAAEHHAEHVRRIIRTFEVLAAQSILEGTMDAIIGTTNTDLIYDFKRLSTHTFDPAVKWDHTDAVIMANLDAACALIRQDGRVTADFVGCGTGAFDAFLKDSEIKDFADNRRYELIMVSDRNPVPDKYNRFIASGWKARARVITPGGNELWFFTNLDGYDDAAGDWVDYMTTTSVMVCSTQARCDRYFGPSDVMPLTPQFVAWYQETFGFSPINAPMPSNIKNSSIIMPGMFYFDAYPSNGRKSHTIRTQAAPIFATTMTDAFVTMTNVLT